jgi:hypothetical protein
MNSIGVDLHKQIITVCVMDDEFQVVARKTLYCNKPDAIVAIARKLLCVICAMLRTMTPCRVLTTSHSRQHVLIRNINLRQRSEAEPRHT